MREDRRAALAIAALAVAVFAPTVLLCGLYLDDYSFLRTLEGVSLRGLWAEFLHYVPGRNLHIPFHYGLIRLTGGSIAAMHAVSVVFEALNAAMVFLFIRRLTGLRSIAWAAATIFVLAPNHGETHFWITLIPQCQIPFFLMLSSLLLASRPGGPRLAAAAAVYGAALFTYDQVFFLWPLLLITAWRGDARAGLRRYAAAAAFFLGMNVTHITLRYVSPSASGGRPLIRIGDFIHRCGDALVAMAKGIIPLQTPSYAHWGWSVAAAAGALAAGLCILWAAGRAVRDERDELARWTRGGGWIAAVAFGAAWTALAYAPNLFWFISPRHNLIPSAGWALALAAAAAAAAGRSAKLSAALPFAALLAFVLAVLANVHEGTQWIAARRLHQSFAAALRHLAPPVDTVFLIGAPRYLHKAPAFNLPHDVMMAAARELGRELVGDYQAAPTRRGIVYYNDLSISPASGARWIPAEKVNLLSYEGSNRSFECAAALTLLEPGGGRRILPLRSSPLCTATVDVAQEVALLESRVLPASAPLARPEKGIALARAEVRTRGRTTLLTLFWAVGEPPVKVVSIIPRLTNKSGAPMLDSIFPYPSKPAARNFFLESFFRSHNPERPYPMLWPLVDDLAPFSRAKPGQILRQVFELRKEVAGSDVHGTLDVDLFEYEPSGTALSSGHFSVPVTVRPDQRATTSE